MNMDVYKDENVNVPQSENVSGLVKYETKNCLHALYLEHLPMDFGLFHPLRWVDLDKSA